MEPTVITNWNNMAVNRRKKRTEPRFPCVDTVLSDGEWRGEPCVILGGGPSLGKVLHRLQEFPGHIHMAGANQAWRLNPAPELVYIIDTQVFDRAQTGDYKDRWNELSGPGRNQIRVTHRGNSTKGEWANAYWVGQMTHRKWGDTLATGILSGNNTGICILNLVDILGADPIILLGFDANSDGNDLNWHSDYPDKPGWRPRDPANTFGKWVKMCGDVAGGAKGKILNANPDSAWPVFEKVSFDEALEATRNAAAVKTDVG